MKPIVRSLLLPLLFSCLVGSASAQIRDDESSQSVLAVQCAVSSGFSASEFEDYSRRLAKTLSLLTSNQQKKVFGYLPQPALASSNEVEAAPAAVSQEQDAIKESNTGLPGRSATDLNSGTATAPATVPAGDTASAGSVVSAIAKGDTSNNLEKAATSIAGSRNGNSSWDAVLSWLSSLAAKARYR